MANPIRLRSLQTFSKVEQSLVLQALRSERFADTALAAMRATLLNEGTCVGSVRTMYRLQTNNNGRIERCRQHNHPAHAKPKLLAFSPS